MESKTKGIGVLSKYVVGAAEVEADPEGEGEGKVKEGNGEVGGGVKENPCWAVGDEPAPKENTGEEGEGEGEDGAKDPCDDTGDNGSKENPGDLGADGDDEGELTEVSEKELPPWEEFPFPSKLKEKLVGGSGVVGLSEENAYEGNSTSGSGSAVRKASS